MMGRGGVPADFFMHTYRKFPELSLLETGRDFHPGLMKSNHIDPRKNVPIRTRGYSWLRTAKLR
jgi:hypothetical protein